MVRKIRARLVLQLRAEGLSGRAIAGSQGMPEGYGPIFDLVLSGQVNLRQLVSHRLPLEEVGRGLKLMDAKAEQVIKVVIEPGHRGGGPG